MRTYHVEASYVIDAPAADLYAVITDYRVGHRAILPKPEFTDMIVEKGGQGAGTVLRVFLTSFGKNYVYHQIASEPEPGRVVKETEIETGQYTTFTFDPLNGGKQTRVTIASEFPYEGIGGFMEKLLAPSFVNRLYLRELRNLADYVHQQKTVTAN